MERAEKSYHENFSDVVGKKGITGEQIAKLNCFF